MFKVFLKSPCFKDISQLTPVILYITHSGRSLLLPPVAVELKHNLGVAEIFVMMRKCCLGYTTEEHAQKERIIKALGDMAMLSRFKVVNNWTTMTTAYTFIKILKQKLLSKVFSGLQLGVGSQKRWSSFCDTLQNVLRRRMCSLVFMALYKNILWNRKRAKNLQKRVALFTLKCFFIRWKEITEAMIVTKRDEKLQKNISYKQTIQFYNIIQNWKKQVRIRKALRAIMLSVYFCAYVERLRKSRLIDDTTDVLRRSQLRSYAKPFKPSTFQS
jgi:hypothetical protein